ncbi:hypothetical protein PG997_001482 [Apiospora hydei]|uniref:Uncharacterized protein n=1 Tax=Apiospora hydei TaxID=1337664 RepID=A0ABR1XDN9_9PEZI
MAGTSGSHRLHFIMPPGLERFPLFFSLPYDIRYKIWKEVVYVPGIHFLKFEAPRTPPRRPNSDEDSDREDDDAASSQSSRRQPRERQRDATPLYSANLKPIYPLPAADLSYYITANKNLTKLSLSCGEAAELLRMSTNKPGNLVLDSARLISLAGSDDVICIDYPDLNWSRNLGSWASKLNQTQLDSVRRLAVKYHPEWDEDRRRCRLCGRVHGSVKPHVHHHLYEFAALFKNLERFYFIDYHTIRRSVSKDLSRLSLDNEPRWPGPSSGHGIAGGQKFLSGGRTYYELDPQDCQLNSKVFAKLDWVRSEYITYCKADPERHSNPAKVKFWVLGCEWDYEQLEYRQNAAHLAKGRSPRRKSHTRGNAQQADIANMMEKMELNGDKGGHRDFEQPAGLPVQFGGNNDSTYQFEFSLKPKARMTTHPGRMESPGKKK